MLIVEVPSAYEREREYVLDVILGDMLGLPYTVHVRERTDVRIRLSGDSRDASVTIPDVLFATPSESWLTPATLPAEPLPWISGGLNGSATSLLPVLYGTPEAGTGVTVEPSGIRLNIDVFGGAFFMLTCYEEMVRPEDDEHGRFPASSSLAARCGFLERPIVNEYVDLLWSALSAVWPGLERRHAEYQVHLTHDVDEPFASRGIRPSAAVRASTGDLLRRRDLQLAWQRVRSLPAARRGDHELDPFNTYGFLMDVSEEHGLKSAFYFLAEPDDSPHPAPYEIDDPAIRAIMLRINDRGHELGLHGSYASLHDATRLRREFAHLRAVTDELGVRQESWGGRQHYLRWRTRTRGGRGSAPASTTTRAWASRACPVSAPARAGSTRSSTWPSDGGWRCVSGRST